MNRTLFTALLAAFASSLCCIAPLLAAVAGIGGLTGSFTWLEPWRPWLMGASVVLLGWAWWLQLKPKPVAADCCPPERKKWYQGQGFLASVTVLAVLLNAFPSFSHALFPGNTKSISEVPTESQRIIIPVKGMTCTGCEHHVTDALASAVGVLQASASYVEEEAVVLIDPQIADTAALRSAIAGTGYEPGTIRNVEP
ncbi:MAG: mercuric transport protein MerTP [Flavobacteriales bacterium]